MFNIILEQTLLCAITQVKRETKMNVVFVRNFIMKVKRDFIVLLARYGSMRMFLKTTFQLTLKICDLNSDANDPFLLSYMFDLAIYKYFRF